MANEKRLIDQEKVYQRACVGCTKHGEAPGECYYDEPCERLIFAFTTAEPVDAVEVVRCKDCMWARPKDHREPTDTPRELICQCAHHHPIPAPWHARMAVKPDDFCSYGERRGHTDV